MDGVSRAVYCVIMLALGRKDLIELEVDELVMWTGRQSEHSTLNRRLIYRVTERKVPEKPEHTVQYKLQVVYDIENPIGAAVDTSPYVSARELKRINLLDLGFIRLALDTFIQGWARSQGVVSQDEGIEP